MINRLLSVALVFLMFSLLQLLTPFTFTWHWLTVSVYCITVLSCFVAANTVRQPLLKNLLKFVPALSLFFVLLTSMMLSPYGNSFTSGWKTTFIELRNRKHSNIYVAQQMIDLGGLGYRRRTVKIVELGPAARWVTTYENCIIEREWKQVNEDLNPFNLK